MWDNVRESGTMWGNVEQCVGMWERSLGRGRDTYRYTDEFFQMYRKVWELINIQDTLGNIFIGIHNKSGIIQLLYKYCPRPWDWSARLKQIVLEIIKVGTFIWDEFVTVTY